MKNLPIPLEVLAGRDLKELDTLARKPLKFTKAKPEPKARSAEFQQPDGLNTGSFTLTKAEVDVSLTITGTFESDNDANLTVPNEEPSENDSSTYTDAISMSTSSDHKDETTPSPDQEGLSRSSSPSSKDTDSIHGAERNLLMSPEPFFDDEAVFLGLRVYTNKTAPATLGSQVRRGNQRAYMGLAKTS